MGFDAVGAVVVWSAVTLGCYLMSRKIYRRWPNWWLMPLAITPMLVGVVLVGFGVPYARYIAGTRWLVWMLGPATVAFAIPIYDQRRLALRHWRVLALGMVAGSVTAIGSSWVLASMVGIDGVLRLSLLPRSISTPFAMDLSAAIGGVPELTSVFVIVTGVMGAVIGEVALARMPTGSTLAVGAMFGVGAHAAGTAHAQRLDPTVAALSGMTMVLTGVLNVVASPLIRLVVG